MKKYASDVAFSPAVKRLQEEKGSRSGYARMEEKYGWQETVTENLAHFIGERDSFYFGTANAEGQPYIQHRGGKPGFLKVLDNKTLAFADFSGNRQYITTGNLSENDKAIIFLMDYSKRRRIKIWGRAKVANDSDLTTRLTDSEYGERPEQVIVFEVDAWDANCPQHISRRYSETEVNEIIAPLKRRIAELEAQLNAGS